MVLFIIVFIAELIMPKGNMKRYIDLIIGLLIIIVIISPLARLMKYDFNIDNIMGNYARSEDLDINMDRNFSNNQEEQIKKLFKSKLESQVIYLVEENWEYKVLDVHVEVGQIQEDNQEIKSIKVLIGRQTGDIEAIEEDKGGIKLEKVPKVEINRIEEKDETHEIIEESKEINKIRKLIASSFSLDIRKIIIEEITEKKGE